MSRQGSTDWLQERAGHATASRFKDILARIKTGEAIKVLVERALGDPDDEVFYDCIGKLAQLLMRPLEELIEQTELVHDLER